MPEAGYFKVMLAQHLNVAAFTVRDTGHRLLFVRMSGSGVFVCKCVIVEEPISVRMCDKGLCLERGVCVHVYVCVYDFV